MLIAACADPKIALLVPIFELLIFDEQFEDGYKMSMCLASLLGFAKFPSNGSDEH